MSYQVFIGYSGEDKNLAKFIYDSLSRIVQIQPYLAEIMPDYGEDFKKRIQNELYKSHYMVVLLTNNGVRSQWVNQEIGYAYALKERDKPFYRGLPHIIPISESYLELKGFITKDTIDMIFLDRFSIEDVMANIIFAIRKKLKRGLEEGFLKIKITCFNCVDERNLSSEYEALMPNHETICKTIEKGGNLVYTCPYCNAENVIDARTFMPLR